jgi:hypothetical protein
MLNVLSLAFLVSLLGDVFALAVLVGKVRGIVKWPWPVCIFLAVTMWLITFLLFQILGAVLQTL